MEGYVDGTTRLAASVRHLDGGIENVVDNKSLQLFVLSITTQCCIEPHNENGGIDVKGPIWSGAYTRFQFRSKMHHLIPCKQ